MIHPQQLITRSDGGIVLAEQLAVGDELPSPTGKSAITKIDRVPVKEWCEVFLHKGPSLMVSPDHRFDGATGHARALTLDSNLSYAAGPAKIDGLVRIAVPAKAVLIEVTGGLYYVKGVLCHDDGVS